MKRVCIYFFYDKDGIVDDYVIFFLKGLLENIDDLLVVVNGKISNESKEKILNVTSNIKIRENKGFDVWAYKEGLEYYGWNKLKKYDEILLVNFTIFGPLSPFKEMFDTMDKKKLDFWGITLFHKTNAEPFGKGKYGYLPTHIQSHFIAIRRSMFESKEFQNYWENMPEINSYEDSVRLHESIFTKTFEDYGFKWEAYIDTTSLKNIPNQPILMTPRYLIENKRCPIIKRRSFFHFYSDFLNNNTGEVSIEAFNYIKNNLEYDTKMILDNILRVQNYSDIKNTLHHNYIFSTKYGENKLSFTCKKVALVLHIYFIDLIQYCFEYAKSMPEEADIYITTDTIEKKKEIERIFIEKKLWNKVEVILIENRGRDVSALLVATKKFIMEYDIVCFAHDKKTPQVNPITIGESFSYKCFENILKNKEFVNNIINEFNKNERLGILSPPPPNHAVFYLTIGFFDWSCNYENVVELSKKCGLNVNIDNNKPIIAPLGTMFWFRPKALKKLYDLNWEYKNFPEEPNKIDGTILHAIERIYPFVVQDAGYTGGWILSDSFAKIEITNLYFMLRNINIELMQIFHFNNYQELINGIRNMNNFKNHIKAIKSIFSLKIKKILRNKYVHFIKK